MQKHSKKRNVPFPRPCGATGNDAQKLHALTVAHFRGAVLMHEVLSVFGEMSERFKEPVLKTGDGATHRGFESHSLRHNTAHCVCSGLYFFDLVLAGGRDRGQNVRGQGNDSGLGAFREIYSVQLSAKVA